jgi:hypothetical protein
MKHKNILPCLFTALSEPNHFASLVVTSWGYKAVVVTPAQSTFSYMISHNSSTSFLTAEKKRR